ncbi:MAG: hypothetical protein ABIP50_02745 [Candidatus Saccharimonadales bacterium]
MSGEWIEPNFAGPTPFLPPEAVRLHDLRKDGRKPTPVDTRTKLVDRRALMIMARESVVPGYDWRAPEVKKKTSNHHLHWPHFQDANSFRNSGSRRTNIAPIAHNWIHELTVPPDAVGEDVEHDYTEAQEYAIELRTIANHPLFLGRETVRIHKEVSAAFQNEYFVLSKQEVRQDIKLDLAFAFDSFAAVFERARQAPIEFQVIDYEARQLRGVHDMMSIAREIGATIRREAELDQKILDGAVDLAA